MGSLSAPQYFLGIDGGGTRCRARLSDCSGQILGEGLGGPANVRLGVVPVWQNLMVAIEQALAVTGLSGADMPKIHIGLGLAGISSNDNARAMIESAPDFGAIFATTDAHAACLGAFSGRDGAIQICGTGSAGYIVNKGVGCGVGGWGFEVADDASAAGLGKAALRAALRGYDKIAPSSEFTEALIDSFGGNPSEIVAFVTTATPSDYGAIAPFVLRYAEAGDVVASELVRFVAAEVGLYLQRLKAMGAERIALLGGLAGPILPWLGGRDAALLSPPEGDAVAGALFIAQGVAKGIESSVKSNV